MSFDDFFKTATGHEQGRMIISVDSPVERRETLKISGCGAGHRATLD